MKIICTRMCIGRYNNTSMQAQIKPGDELTIKRKLGSYYLCEIDNTIVGLSKQQIMNNFGRLV